MFKFAMLPLILLASHFLLSSVDTALDPVITVPKFDFQQAYLRLLVEVHKLKAIQSHFNVTFQACASKKTNSYKPGDRVEFDYVILNNGGAYHPENSSFVCPYPGIYRFDLHVLSTNGYRFTARIMKNSIGGQYSSGYAEALAKDQDTHHSASNSVYLPCQKGDVIWVVTGQDQGVEMSMWGGEGRRCLSNFSGKFVATL